MENFGLFKEAMSGVVDMAKGVVVEKTKGIVEKSKEAVGKAKEMVGLVNESEAQQPTPPEDPTWMDELNQSCNLTYKQRIQGFVACLSLGLLCTLLSMLVLLHPVKFAVTYSVGNIMALGSTGFLIGFSRQLKMMFDPIRIGAAVVFAISIVLTLVAALYVGDPLLTLLCILVQGSALTWYSLSYIPFAQASAKRCFRACYESEF